MKVILYDATTGEATEALILAAKKGDMPAKKNSWQFTWKKLAKVEGAQLFKIVTADDQSEIEGVLMLTLISEEMLYLNNIEVAPHNYGSEGKYRNVAGSLLAFACYQSFELGRNHYIGFLSFESKTQLIALYQNKYGATCAMGQKMFFDPTAGRKLMKKCLLIDFEEE